MKESFAFLADSTKQLITVATGVITFTVVFSKELDTSTRNIALGAWFMLLLSVFCGIAALYIMSGRLAAATDAAPPKITGGLLQKTSLAQLATFILGVALVMVFGFKAANVQDPPAKPLRVTIDPMPPAPIVNVYPTPAAPAPVAAPPPKASQPAPVK